MVRARIITSDGRVYEQDVEGKMGYTEFRKLEMDQTKDAHIISESFMDEDDLILAQSTPDSNLCPNSIDQFQCSSWESGLLLSSVRDIASSPMLWFYNIVGHRLQTLKQYFKHGNLVFTRSFMGSSILLSLLSLG